MYKVFLTLKSLLFVFVINAQVSGIHWASFQTPLKEVAVLWINTSAGDSIKWGYSEYLENGSFAATSKLYKSRFVNGFTFHEIMPDITIMYAIYDSYKGSWSQLMKYKTPQGQGASFKFTALGDSRTYWDKWKAVADNVLATDFAIFMGDIVTAGGDTADWDNWFKYGEQYLANNQIYHCVGNHELRGDASAENYKNLFAFPSALLGNELYYSFEYNQALFICLDSERPSDTIQYKWLIEKLKTVGNYRWTFVWFHRPFFTYPSHIGEMNAYFETWWKAFDDYGVDVVFNGHTHNYQRSVPINLNVVKDSNVASYGNCSKQGRCQIVTGGAGAPPVGVGKGWFIEQTYNGNHFVNIEVFPDSLLIKTLTPEHFVIDSFSIVRYFKPDIIGDEVPVCFGDTVLLSGIGADNFEWDNGLVNNEPFTPDSTSDYMMIATDSAGCVDTIFTKVEVLPSYSFYDTMEICNGDSIFWQNKYRKLNADYTEYYNTIQNCDSSFFLNLKVNNKPNDFEIVGDTKVESNVKYVYTISFVDSLNYSWDVKNGLIENIQDDTLIVVQWADYENGTIEVLATNKYNCDLKKVVDVEIISRVGVNNVEKALYSYESINKALTIHTQHSFSVEIYNLTGRKIIESTENNIILNKLLPGVYIARIICNDVQESYKILIPK